MSKLTNKDLELLTTELASFARTGTPMPEGLAQLSASLPDGNLKLLSDGLARSTSKGEPLFEALANQIVTVPDHFSAIVRCGENSGDLTSALDFALKNSRQVKQHLTTATTLLVYPVLVCIILLIISVFASFTLIPFFKSMYDQLGAQMPWLTEITVGAGDFLSSTAGIIFSCLLMGFLIWILVCCLRDKLPDNITNLIPGTRRLMYLSDTSIMMEFMNQMLSHGIPLSDSCRVASLVVSKNEMKSSLERMATAVEQGQISADEINPNVPASAAWLYRQGENRGSLAEVCADIAQYSEAQFKAVSKQNLGMLEPLLIMTVGVFCGFALISLYLPLMFTGCVRPF